MTSPILSIAYGDVGPRDWIATHSHPESLLLCSSTATATIATGSRDWLVPPGFGLWIPGGTEHAGGLVRAGEGSIIAFAPENCPITWPSPPGWRSARCCANSSSICIGSDRRTRAGRTPRR